MISEFADDLHKVLSVLLGSAEMLARVPVDDPEAPQHLDLARRAGREAAALIERLRQVSGGGFAEWADGRDDGRTVGPPPSADRERGRQRDSPTTNDDWFVASIDEIEHASEALHAALNDAMDAIGEARAARLEGAGRVELVHALLAHGVRDLRLGATDAFKAWETAVAGLRAKAVRALVEEEQLTFTEVGKLLCVSRQMVARLYRSAGTAP